MSLTWTEYQMKHGESVQEQMRLMLKDISSPTYSQIEQAAMRAQGFVNYPFVNDMHFCAAHDRNSDVVDVNLCPACYRAAKPVQS